MTCMKYLLLAFNLVFWVSFVDIFVNIASDIEHISLENRVAVFLFSPKCMHVQILYQAQILSKESTFILEDLPLS